MWFKKKKTKINYDYKPIDREAELQKIRDEIASRPKYYPTLWWDKTGVRFYPNRIEWIRKVTPQLKIYAGKISPDFIYQQQLNIDGIYGRETRQLAGLYHCFQSLAEVEREMETIDQLLDEIKLPSWSYTYCRK